MSYQLQRHALYERAGELIAGRAEQAAQNIANYFEDLRESALFLAAVPPLSADEASERRLGEEALAAGDYPSAANFFAGSFSLRISTTSGAAPSPWAT